MNKITQAELLQLLRTCDIQLFLPADGSLDRRVYRHRFTQKFIVFCAPGGPDQWLRQNATFDVDHIGIVMPKGHLILGECKLPRVRLAMAKPSEVAASSQATALLKSMAAANKMLRHRRRRP